jgi:hypothetical protein
MTIDWGALLVGQLAFYWDAHLRPRLDGLTNAEFFWEPVDGCWTVRPNPDGAWVLDLAWPEPSPPPVTTIAWRIAHIGAGIATRVSTFFGDGTAPPGTTMFDPWHQPDRLPGNAADAVAFLDDTYRAWHTAIAALSVDELARPLGSAGAYFAEEPMAALISHLNREIMHHGGEICLLRDLYRARRH